MKPAFLRPALLIVLITGMIGAAASTAAEVDTASVVVEVAVGDVAATKPAGKIHFEAIGGAGTNPDDSPAVERDLQAPGRLELNAPPGSIWRVSAAFDGHWAEEAVATAGRPARLVLWPTGTVEGTLRLPRAVAPPERIDAHFAPPPAVRALRGQEHPKGRVSCPVEETAWRCELPEGVHDLRLHATGSASVLRWEVPVAAAQATDLGVVELVPGASLFGRIEIDGGTTTDTRRVEIELRPAGAGWRDRFGSTRLEHLFRTTNADERGFFQLADLAPGHYRVEAIAPGLVPNVRAEVEVLAGRETLLEPALLLTPPSELTVLLEPAVPPSGRVWTLRLYPRGHGEEAASALADDLGFGRFPALAPGRYRLTVEDGGSTWRTESLEVGAAPSTFELTLPLVPIEGTVTRGERPQRARLELVAATSDERIRIFTDREGAFSGFLPAEGEWGVRLLFEAGGGEIVLDPVDVHRPPDRTPFRLDLELPRNLLAGTVRDSAGRTVTGAHVAASLNGSSRRSSTAETDEEGRFRFWSIEPGPWTVDVFTLDFDTGQASADVAEEGTTVLDVTLLGHRGLHGRIVARSGVVAGATVYVMPELPVARRFGVRPLKTDPHGEFRAKVPADAVGAHLLVLAPGQAARLLFLPVGAGSTEGVIEIALSDLMGTIRLELPERPASQVDLIRGAARMPLTFFREWALFHGVDVAGHPTALPALEPGLYRLCAGSVCAGGVLPLGGELLISLSGAEQGAGTKTETGAADAGR